MRKINENQDTRKKGEVRAGGFDTHGNTLASVKERDQGEKDESIRRKEEVESLVMGLSTKEMVERFFFIIHTNVFVENKYSTPGIFQPQSVRSGSCLLYTSDAADE